MALLIRDGISPALAAMAKKISDRKPVLEAMALQLVSITKRAFSDSSLRAKSWPARKRPAPHQLLRKSGALFQSIRVAEVTQDHSSVASDRVYAAAQQFGTAKGLPPRPYFPFASPTAAMTATAQEKLRKVAEAKIQRILGAK